MVKSSDKFEKILTVYQKRPFMATVADYGLLFAICVLIIKHAF
jgi:hypothetical protein